MTGAVVLPDNPVADADLDTGGGVAIEDSPLICGMADMPERNWVDQVQDALKHGELHPDLAEELYIVPSSDLEAVVFQETMRALAETVYGDLLRQHGIFRSDEVRFLLMDTDEQNACYLKNSEPPRFCFSKSLFLNPDGSPGPIDTVDKLAWVIGHELWHWHLSHRHSGSELDSMVEEGLCDSGPIEYMYNAGLAPDEARKGAEALFDPDPKSSVGKVLTVFGSTHPSKATRVKAVTISLSALDEKLRVDLTKVPATPLLKACPDLVDAARTVNRVSRLDRMRATCDFDNLGKLEKLEAVRELLATGRICGDDLREIAWDVKDLKIDRRNPAEQEAQDELGDLILDLIPSYDADSLIMVVYDNLCHGTHTEDPIPVFSRMPLGRMARLDEGLVALRESTDQVEAEALAASIVDQFHNDPLVQSVRDSHVISGMRFSRISDFMELRGKLKHAAPLGVDHPPFVVQLDSPPEHQRLFEMAKLEAQREGHSRIAEVLLLNGVDDVRLYPLVSQAAFLRHIEGNSRSINISLSVDNYDQCLIHYSDDGLQITVHPRETKVGQKGVRAVHDQELQRRLKVFAVADSTLVDKAELSELLKARSAMLRNEDSEELICEEIAPLNLQMFLEINFDRTNSDAYSHQSASFPLEQHQRVVEIFDRLLPANRERYAADIRAFILQYREGDPYLSREEYLQDGKALENPYVRWMIADPHNLFTNDEKRWVLSGAVSFDKYNGAEPAERTELARVCRGVVDAATGELSKREEAFIGSLEALEAYNNTEAGQIDLNAVEQLYLDNPNLSGTSEFRSRVRDHIEQVGLPSDGSVLARITRWQVFNRADLLPYSKRYEYLDQLLTELESEHPEYRRRATESLLVLPRPKDGYMTSRAAAVQHPTLRSKAVSMWAEALAETIGVDDARRDNHTEYQKRMFGVVSQLNRHWDPFVRREMLLAAARATQTQAYMTREVAESIEITQEQKEFLASSTPGSLVEGAVALVRGDVELRLAAIHYVTSERTEETTTQFVEALDTALLQIKSFNLPTEVQQSRLLRASPEEKREAAELMHIGYTEVSVAQRAVGNYELLFGENTSLRVRPAGGQVATELELLQCDPFEFVLENIMSSDSPYSEDSKKFIQAYVKVVPEYKRALMVSGLMGAARRSESEEISFPEAVAIIVESLGPAEYKVGQQAHSHPDTGDEFREPLGKLKHLAGEPDRVELTKWIEAAKRECEGDPALRDVREELLDIEHVGEVIGAASFFVVVNVRMRDGSHRALALLRPNAREHAVYGFDLLQDTLDELGADQEFVGPLREMLAEGRRKALIETDLSIAQEQFELAAEFYPRWGVELDGDLTTFSTPTLYAAGPSFLMMDLMEGEDFNELAESSSADPAELRSFALSVVTMELANIFQGNPFDDDRHGRNIKKFGELAQHLDLGSMRTERATPDQLRELGRTMYRISQQVGSDTDRYGAVVLAEFTAASEANPETASYNAEVQRALLAMNDLIRWLQPGDLEMAFRAATKRADRSFKDGLMEGLAPTLTDRLSLGWSQHWTKQTLKKKTLKVR